MKANDTLGHQLERWLGLRGLLSLALGVIFLLRPASRGVSMLVAAFIVYCFADGMLALGHALGGETKRDRALWFLHGIVSIAVGAFAFARPGTGAVYILVLIAVRAIAVGILELALAASARGAVSNPWSIAVPGIVSIVLGVLMLRHPSEGLMALAWLVGAYGVLIGVAQLGTGLALHRSLERRPPIGPTLVQPR
jgi:uncharacterized membrane protein HdeD (DUF308 family)